MKQYLFKPNEQETNFIYEHIDSWTDWCRDKLRQDMDRDRFNKWNRVSLYLLLTVIGLVLSFIGLIVSAPPGIMAGIFVMGGVIVVFGAFGIIGVYRYG